MLIAGMFHDRSKVSLINCITMAGHGGTKPSIYAGCERKFYSHSIVNEREKANKYGAFIDGCVFDTMKNTILKFFRSFC